jgi:hypothetical protein
MWESTLSRKIKKNIKIISPFPGKNYKISFCPPLKSLINRCAGKKNTADAHAPAVIFITENCFYSVTSV